jgi:hypothetical protein
MTWPDGPTPWVVPLALFAPPLVVINPENRTVTGWPFSPVSTKLKDAPPPASTLPEPDPGAVSVIVFPETENAIGVLTNPSPTSEPMGQYSADGAYWWDGRTWLPISPDRRYYWTGAAWQPIESRGVGTPPAESHVPPLW